MGHDEEHAQVFDDPTGNRYELRLGERVVGTIEYVRRGDTLVLAHVGVDPELRRRGFASRLLEGALDDIRARGLSVVPACAFASWYLRRHPEYEDVVARSSRPPRLPRAAASPAARRPRR